MTSLTAMGSSVLLAGTLLLLLGGAAHAQRGGPGPCPAFHSTSSFTSAPSGDYAVLLSFDPFHRCMKLSFFGTTYAYTYYDTAEPNPTQQTVSGATTFQATSYASNGYLRLSELPYSLLGGDPFGTSTLRAVYYGDDYQVYSTCTEFVFYHIMYAIVLVPEANVTRVSPSDVQSSLDKSNFPEAMNLYTTYSTVSCNSSMPLRR